MKVFIASLLVSLALGAFVPSHIENDSAHGAFLDFQQTYNKNYDMTAEYIHRFGVFKTNLAGIQEHNAKNLGFSLAMNEFGDLTSEEFGAIYNGLNFDINAPRSGRPMPKLNVSAPSTVDWRQKGAVTAVKNQGQCGSCWSFSTTGSMEGAWFLAKGDLVSLSEKNLMDCSGSFGNQGCNGGLMDNAFKYVISNKGDDTEASYPYEPQDGPCKFNRANVGATISSYHDVPQGDESALQSAAAKTPVSVAIDASHMSFQFYSHGVYYESSCSSTQLDHGVLVVGYGTDSGKDYWLVKNSWGASWGLSGYIQMSRNKNNNCGIATSASYPIV